MSPTASGPARVLAVCTGNVCRSPLVERLLAPALGPGVVVSSAGTRAVRGAPVQPAMADHLRARGGSAEGFVAQGLTAPMAAGADLVLALTRTHRSAVVRATPRAARWTFTLRELARLLEGTVVPGADPAARVRAAAAVAAARRDRVTAARPDDDDVPDPFGGSGSEYAQSAALVAAAVDVVVRALVPPAPVRR